MDCIGAVLFHGCFNHPVGMWIEYRDKCAE